MSLTLHLGAIFCVFLIAAGQVLFKLAARAYEAAGTMLATGFIFHLGAALAIYAVATLAWVALLRSVPLGRIYPYMALSFVFVALASRYLLGEAVTPRQIAGLGLVVAGLAITATG